MRPTGSRRFVAMACAAAVAMLLTACTGSGSKSQGSRVNGGDVTFAEVPGAPPNYIFPMDSLAYFSTSNLAQFQYLMWRPLYWIGDGKQVKLNEALSLAKAPSYSKGNTVVTISLKTFAWSDGKPVTSRDVLFWINLLRANKENWGEYAPGYFPDDVAKVSAPSARTVVLTLKSAVNPTWFNLSELTQITPLPQHAWDKPSADGRIGTYDTTTAGAKAVYGFLDGQSKKQNTFATNKLWQIVDGPWKLSEYSAAGRAKFVPNAKYSGPVKPKLDSFTEVPFTSGTAEFNALRAGSVTYGYIPQTDIGQTKTLTAQGFQVEPWYLWSMNILPINFNNPKTGPMFRQLYIRHAMQSLINQKQYVSTILHGDGAVDYGPVPTLPTTRYLTDLQRNGAYPFDVAKAARLLSAHGWSVKASGTSTCARPGSGAGRCGAGISAGAKLSFNLVYAAGIPEVSQEMQAWKSDLSRIGITLNLSQAPTGDVFSTITPCTAKQAACAWQMAYWGNGWEFSPDYYPSGEVAFSTGAIGNWGSYSDKHMDAKIEATTAESSSTAFHDWADYTATQLPMLFMPLAASQVSVVKSTVHGAFPQPVAGLAITPENWYLTK